jgi:mono/diheme cytochrome c family protein
MEYPILHWTFWGGGLLVALVATIHVFISHFAVGGGLFIAVLETRAQRLGLSAANGYLQRFAGFFLVLTMVVGALTGVGIWFSISITAPAATSTLIHVFVLGWATEWTFFLAEIVTIMAYMRAKGGENARRRLILAWLYFLFAFASLAIVQGFISFMLTPGQWLETHRFWDGFFNPTYLPGLVFRSAMAAVLAGAFALAVAQTGGDEAERKRLSRFCALWAVLPIPVAVAAGWWHIAVLSPEQQALVWGRSPEVAAGMRVFMRAVPAVVAGGVLLAGLLGGRLPRKVAWAVSVATLTASFLFIGSFEYMREAARRPYLITGYIFSNGILVSRAEELNRNGVLASAKWSRIKAATGPDRLEAGRELFHLECAGCHSLGGPMLDILPISARFSLSGMEAWLTGQGKIDTYMPPFLGTKDEKKALAAYLTEGLHGEKPAQAVVIKQTPEAVPAFDEAAQYVLTAVADKGINMFADATGRWTMGLGTQGLTAHLIRRGPSPELVTEGVTVTYAIEGQAGGSLKAANGAFRADVIPVSPYPKNPEGDGFQPYPLALVTASDVSGKVLAETKVVLPVSTELGCKNCHGGPWKHGVAGIADETARDVLTTHDRLSGTRLLELDKPVDCRSCHVDAATGGGRALNLSAAIHGLHAVYLAGRGGEACNLCHPTDPKGATRAFRDPHQDAGLDCSNCHGVMEDLALSLLNREKNLGVTAAAPLLQLIEPRATDPAARASRAPWVNEPRCLTCHVSYQSPQTDLAHGAWTAGQSDLFMVKRDDMDALTCPACHGAAHAVYPASNPYGKDRDNLQPLQYQKLARTLGAGKNCKVCHTVDMDEAAHHAGMGLE